MQTRFKSLALTTVAVLAMVAAACAPAPASGPGGGPNYPDFRFTANKVTVVNHNDSFFYGTRDEPYAVNLWFRVKVGVPNSAQVGVVGDRSQAIDDLGDGESHALSASRQAAVDFNDVELLDVGDLLNTNKHLEIVGTWTWAMERDDVGVTGVMGNVTNVVKNTLNNVVGNGTLPSDPADLVPMLLGDFGDAFDLIAGALFSSIPGIPDDAVGSRFYIGVASTGTLSNIVDATVPASAFPLVEIPVVTIPPDIDGGQIFSLGHNNAYSGEQFSSGDGRHDYDVSMVNVATIPQPPVASFTPSATSGSPGLGVTFDASGSNDPDGTIVAYNWTFGDFTTGAGALTAHTFNTAGTFPVTLTVTDDSGMSSSTTTNIAIGGAPTVAPTGLTKTGSGCCNTYGDFAWNPVPGATAYQIQMSSYFGGGCLVDASATINGQASSGRVQAAGLCLGSKYDTKIRAQANGQWGPWSAEQRFTL